MSVAYQLRNCSQSLLVVRRVWKLAEGKAPARQYRFRVCSLLSKPIIFLLLQLRESSVASVEKGVIVRELIVYLRVDRPVHI